MAERAIVWSSCFENVQGWRRGENYAGQKRVSTVPIPTLGKVIFEIMGLKLFFADLRAATQSRSVLVNAKWFLLSHSLHMLFFFRLGQSLSSIPFFGKLFRFVIEYWIRVVYSSDISCLSTIGPGFVIVHGHDIVIGADVVIGRNCKIFNGVTLGNKDVSQSSLGNQPTVGDNVILSTGAKILGAINVGSNVIVGANSVVLIDCPCDTVVAGVPAKIVKRR